MLVNDFNDVHKKYGLPEVARQINKAIDAAFYSGKPPAPSDGATDSKELEKTALTHTHEAGRYTLQTLFDKFAYIYGTKHCWDGVRGEQMELSHLGHLVGRERYKMWMDSPLRRTVQGIRFEPGVDLGDDWINLFTGWPLEPKKGECRRILSHIQRLCGNRSQEYIWLLQWLAYPLQNPGAKMASAVIVHGAEGTGKSITFDVIMGAIYGEYKTTIGQQQLESSFTEWQSKRLFAVAEEVVSRSERNAHKGMLKHLVTGSTLQIDQKHMSLRQESNHMNLVFLSNSTVPLELDVGDRRYLVLYADDVPPAQYFDDLFAEIKNGGTEAFFEYLLRLDLSNFSEHSKPPYNEEKEHLVNASMSSPQYFHLLWKNGELDIPYGCATTNDLYRYFKRWAENNGEFKRTQRFFSSELQRVMMQGRYRFSYPSITEPQKQHRVFVSKEQLAKIPDAKRMDDWVGHCCIEFNKALDNIGIVLND